MKTKDFCGVVLALICAFSTTLKAQNIYVANPVAGTIGEYAMDGTGTTTLISGLSNAVPRGMVISGTNLFVALTGSNCVAEYSTSGKLLNPSFITGLTFPECMAISGTNLFVGQLNGIAEYTTSGQLVNSSLITGIQQPLGIAISGTNMFVAQENSFVFSVGEYTTSGQTINDGLITGFLDQPTDLVVSGTNLFIVTRQGVALCSTSGDLISGQYIFTGITAGIALMGTNLFVSDARLQTISEFTTDAARVHVPLVTGVVEPYHFAIGNGPPPPTPQLSIATQGNQSVLFYPSWASGYQLQSVTNVASTNWAALSNSVPIIGATVTNSSPANFFRLAPIISQ